MLTGSTAPCGTAAGSCWWCVWRLTTQSSTGDQRRRLLMDSCRLVNQTPPGHPWHTPQHDIQTPWQTPWHHDTQTPWHTDTMTYRHHDTQTGFWWTAAGLSTRPHLDTHDIHHNMTYRHLDYRTPDPFRWTIYNVVNNQGSHSHTDKKIHDFLGPPWKIFQDLFGAHEYLNIKKKTVFTYNIQSVVHCRKFNSVKFNIPHCI